MKTNTIITPCLSLVLLLPACAGEEEETASPDENAEESSDSGMQDEIVALYDCVDEELVEVGPLAGPGYDPGAGLLDPVQDTYVAHTTQILVKPEEQMRFLQLVGEIQQQLESTEGFVALSLAIEPNCGFSRTLGLWRSEEDMYRFVATGAHADAMTQTGELAVTGKTTSWTLAATDMPLTWETAKAQLADVEPLVTY